VYTSDPKKDPGATRYHRVSFDEAIQRNLKVMDATALALCRDQRLPVNVFSIFRTGALGAWSPEKTKAPWCTSDGGRRQP